MPLRELTFTGALDLKKTVGPLVRGRSDPTSFIDGDSFVRASRTPEGPGAFEVVVTHSADGGTLRAEAWGEGADWLLARIDDIVGVNDVPPLANSFPEPIRGFAKSAHGARLPHVPSVFELLLPVVLEQLVTGLESKRAYRNLVAHYSEAAPGPFNDLFLPPAASVVKRINPDAWMPLGIIRKQGETLRRIAERAHRIDEVAAMSLEDATARLTAIPGIGPWTAGMVLLHGLGHADAVPTGDYHLPNTVAWNFVGEDRATDERMLELLEPFSGQRGRVIRFIESSGKSAPRYGPRRAVRRNSF